MYPTYINMELDSVDRALRIKCDFFFFFQNEKSKFSISFKCIERKKGGKDKKSSIFRYAEC